MAGKPSSYVIGALSDDAQVNEEVLLTAAFLLEKWKKDQICGPDQQLAELLEREEFDSDAMERIRQLLIRFASHTGSIQLFAQAVGVIALFEDKRDIPLFQSWLLKHADGLIRQNSAVWALFLALNNRGEGISQRRSLSESDMDANLADIRKYLAAAFGVMLPS